MKKWLIALAIAATAAACGGGGGGGFSIPPDNPINNAQAAPARALSPVTLHVQWPTTGDFKFARGCHQPNAGGQSCFYFPSGGKIWNISWQSSLKMDHDEVLLMLVMSQGDGELDTSPRQTLLTTHHTAGAANDCNSIVSKDIVLQGYVEIPPGHYVWLYGEGALPFTPAGVEVQTTIYVEGNASNP